MSLPRCPVCRNTFVEDIDDLCAECSENTECLQCETNGHKKMFHVEDWGGGGWTTPVDGWLCHKHFTNAYGPEPRFGVIMNCMNISCDGHTEEDDSNFCYNCDYKIRHGICTKCDRKLGIDETVDMYGHCINCGGGGELDLSICRGCQEQYDPDQIQDTSIKHVHDLCEACVTRVENWICTSCFEETAHVDEYGRCRTCSPDNQYICTGAACKRAKDASRNTYNRVSDKNKQCAKCQLGWE
jgi:hypothetical protein